MIRAIYFDFGGVLINTDFDGLYAEFAKRLRVDSDWAERIHEEHLAALLNGTMSAREFFALFQKKAHYGGDIFEIWKKTGREFIVVNQELINFIDSLRGKFIIAALSNVSEPRGIIDEEFGLYGHFDQLFLSYKLKMVKPHREIYDYAFKTIGVKPEEAVFIDDNSRNLKPSGELGFRPVLFKNNEQLFSDLRELGIY